MMRENNDPTVIHSSIALLQERFRQLQREKEMRKERDLRRRLNSADRSGLSFDPELLIFPPRSPPQVSLSLWPSWQSKPAVADHRVAEVPLLINLWPSESLSRSRNTSSNKCDDYVRDDVDTSLHL